MIKALCSCAAKRKKKILVVISTLIVYIYLQYGDGEYSKCRPPDVSHSELQCSQILSGDAHEISTVENETKTLRGRCLDELWFIEKTKDCSVFIKERNYRNVTTKEEDLFPVAFSLLVFEQIEQVDRLLQAIYRPSNYYCIHVDEKSSRNFHKAVESITKCFPNIHKTTKSHAVKWAEIGIVLAEIECMKLLWTYKKWKYFINLTGHEFPLKTNLQIVRILKALNGFNIIDGHFKGLNRGWFEKVWWGAELLTPFSKSTPPHNITIAKGSTHIIACRGFIDYILHNQTAKDFLYWIRNIRVPDEHYFASLNHNTHLKVPGGYQGDPDKRPKYHIFTRHKIWQSSITTCHGKWVRYVCNIACGDLKTAVTSRGIMLNKILLAEEPVAFRCLEEWYKNQTYIEQQFNSDYYKAIIQQYPR